MEEPVHFNYLMTSRRSPLNGPRKIHSWSCQTLLALQSSQDPRRVAPVELSASVFHLNHFSSREWSVLLWPSRKTKVLCRQKLGGRRVGSAFFLWQMHGAHISGQKVTYPCTAHPVPACAGWGTTSQAHLSQKIQVAVGHVVRELIYVFNLLVKRK